MTASLGRELGDADSEAARALVPLNTPNDVAAVVIAAADTNFRRLSWLMFLPIRSLRELGGGADAHGFAQLLRVLDGCEVSRSVYTSSRIGSTPASTRY